MIKDYVSSCCHRRSLLEEGEPKHEKTKTHVSSRDKGWAWVIVLASFTIQLLIDGTISGFGVFFMEIQKDEEFTRANYTNAMLALPGNIQPGFFLCTGAFVSPLIQRFGFRVMGGIASAMVGSGLALASIQRNLHLFNLFYGVLTGSGFGILIVCAVVPVNFYFERFRGIASGIAMSGSGVGYLTIPIVFNRLCNQFGWRRGLLIYSALAFLCAFFSVLSFRPFVVAVLPEDQSDKNNTDFPTTLTPISDEEHKPEMNFYIPVIVNPEGNVDELGKLRILPTELNTQQTVSDPGQEALQGGTGMTSDAMDDRQRLVEQRKSLPGLHGLRNKSSGLESINEMNVRNNLGHNFVETRMWASTLAFKTNQEGVKPRQYSTHECLLRVGSSTTHIYHTFHARGSYIVRKGNVIADPFQRVDIFYSSSLAILEPRDALIISHHTNERPEPGESGRTGGSQISLPRSGYGIFHSGSIFNRPHGLHDGSANNFHSNYIGSCTSFKPVNEHPISNDQKFIQDGIVGAGPDNYVAEEIHKPRFRDRMIHMFDLKLFTNVRFLYLMTIGITNQLAYFIPFVYLMDYTMNKGLPANRAVVLSVILGSMHTIGRFLSGIVSNASWIDTVYLSGFGTLAAALTHLALPTLLPSNFSSFALYAAMFGLFIALPVPMIHLLLVRFLGLERLTASYSNLNLVKGIASVIGPMIAVGVVDLTGERGNYFLVAGVCLLLSAIAHLGLCRFPCSKPHHHEDRMDERALCCFCTCRRGYVDSNEGETNVYTVESEQPVI